MLDRLLAGRGVRCTSGQTQDISLDAVCISFQGVELLENASLKFVHGHRYGLLAENGAGKSTLLRRIAKGSIPGFPQHFGVIYLQQEVPVVISATVLEYVVGNSSQKRIDELKEEEEALDLILGDPDSDEHSLVEASERLGLITEELEQLELQAAQPQLGKQEHRSNKDILDQLVSGGTLIMQTHSMTLTAVVVCDSINSHSSRKIRSKYFAGCP
jgi:ATPase subunit of ABC transporter with duplicated ATPase domains